MINVLEYLENTMLDSEKHDKIAFAGDDDQLSFMELSRVSRSIGTCLAKRDIFRKPIAIFMEKSPAMIAAFLGTLYSGNYYVPLDAEIPLLRIKLILETCNPPLIICDEKTQKLINEWELKYPTVKYSEIKSHNIDEAALAAIRKQSIDTDPMYIVFTSGSTGLPKGVIANHRSVIDYIEHLSKVLDVDSKTIYGVQSPLYLDACLKEIYPTLKFGATSYLIPRALFMFPIKLLEYIVDKEINTICWVASALGLVAGLGALQKCLPHTLKTIAFGSEVFPIKHYNLWRESLPDAKFIHLYGPTEATGMSTYYETKRTYSPDESIPIGRPFINTEIVLLDDNNQTPAVGEAGEICIRGTCLTMGYFGNPELTNKVFVQNPLSDYPDLIYKTGDLGYFGADGELYFLSRKDHQIKHMGHRIELKEIEWYATQCVGIEMACALFDKTDSKIILFCLSKSMEKPDIVKYLKTNLPRYMMPHVTYKLDDMPLTPGGKFDRAGLLEKHKKERSQK